MMAATAIVTLMTACACSSAGQSAAEANPPRGKNADELPCTSTLTRGPLPTWAQGGFTPPDQPVYQVRGVDGSILGVVFEGPSDDPSAKGHAKKILWVSSPLSESAPSPSDPDLRIHATLNGSDVAIDRVISGGPGPSIVDVPAAGCWTVILKWSGRTDRLALYFR